jgi:hypothetical protein
MNLVGGIALVFFCLVVIYFIFWGGGLALFASLFDWGYRPAHGIRTARQELPPAELTAAQRQREFNELSAELTAARKDAAARAGHLETLKVQAAWIDGLNKHFKSI